MILVTVSGISIIVLRTATSWSSVPAAACGYAAGSAGDIPGGIVTRQSRNVIRSASPGRLLPLGKQIGVGAQLGYRPRDRALHGALTDSEGIGYLRFRHVVVEPEHHRRSHPVRQPVDRSPQDIRQIRV